MADEYVYVANKAIITNRNSGYRWMLRREERRVEFVEPVCDHLGHGKGS